MKVLATVALLGVANAAAGVYTDGSSQKIACTENANCTDNTALGTGSCCIKTDTADATNNDFCSTTEGVDTATQTCYIPSDSWVQGARALSAVTAFSIIAASLV